MSHQVSRATLFRLLGVAVVCLAAGCSSSKKAATPDAQALSGADETIFFGDTIEKNYDPHVIMKRAEAFFEKEDYPEAIIEYQHFLDLHRVHLLAPYAQYKLGESHYKMFKTVDRDPSPIKRALEAYQKLLHAYPGSTYENQASEKIEACHDLLGKIHLIIGQFYYRRDAYLAAAYRFEAILKEYPDRPIAADALYHLAKTYEDLGAQDWTHEKLLALAQRYPDHAYTKKTRKWLAQLNRDNPTRFAAREKQPDVPQVAALAPSLNGHQSANGQAGLNGTAVSNGQTPGTNGHSPVLNGQPYPAAASPVSTVSALHPSHSSHPASNGTGLNGISTTAPVTPTITLCRLGVWC